VLADLAGEAIDRVVCLGDVAATGPQPRQVVARLRSIGCQVVMGNADAELLTPPAAAADSDDDAGRVAAISRWGAAQLAADDLDYLGSFQPTVTVVLGADVAIHCCHGSPRSFDEPIAATTPAGELDAMLNGVTATIVAAGHTHVQLIRRHREVVLLNPGTVGLACAPLPPAGPTRNVPWAEYAVVSADGGRCGIELRRVPFDLAALTAATRASGMPHAEWWIADWGR
jgi:predicted phosphodiesterase